MEFNLREGLDWTEEITVMDKDTAAKYASGSVNVFATPAMVALMECASKNCVDKFLPEGFSTVGIKISTSHIKATPVNMKVVCQAVLEKIEDKKLFFKVTAWDEEGKIGEGTHERYIINIEDFIKKVNR